MSIQIAKKLYETGRGHAPAASVLFDSSLAYAHQNELPDPELFAFNGTFSLSVHYLIGLGLEILLKAAYVAYGGNADDKHLRDAIGHDLVRAHEMAESRGFVSEAPNLREITEHLREPHKAHYFRYSRPDEFPLPDVLQVTDAFSVLDDELRAKLYPEVEA